MTGRMQKMWTMRMIVYYSGRITSHKTRTVGNEDAGFCVEVSIALTLTLTSCSNINASIAIVNGVEIVKADGIRIIVGGIVMNFHE